MQSDRQLTWMIDLDWRQHRAGRMDGRTDHGTIPETAIRLGEELCAPWLEEPGFLSFADVELLDPDLLDEHAAFDPAGMPVPAVHERSAGLIRRKAEELRVAVSDPRALTLEEWSDVHLAAWLQASLGAGARRAASGMAPILARLAADGEIETYTTRLGGGPATPLPAAIWRNISDEQAIRRFAACGLSLASPYDPAAAIDSLILIGEHDLDAAIRRAALTRYVPTIVEDVRVWRPVDDRPIKLGDAMWILRDIMSNSPVMSNEALKRAFLEITGVELGKRRFEEAKRKLVAAHPSFNDFARGGPRQARERRPGRM